MIAYPAIPFPSAGSFAERVSVPTLQTTLETGLVRQRPRFSTGLREFRASWELTQSEFAIFQEWFATDLVGGLLAFEMDWGGPERVYRFAGGRYTSTQGHGGRFNVSGNLECLDVFPANATTIPPVAPWLRLVIDPVADQQLTLSHRNAKLTSRPTTGNTRTLRVYNPVSPNDYIYFGLQSYGAGDTLITSESAVPLPVLAAAVWPNSLPRPLSGFGEAQERPAMRLPMDSGHIRQQQRFDASVPTYSITWNFSAAEMATFETFFFTTLQNGSRQFTIPLPVDNAYNAVPVRFDGAYTSTYRAVNRFQVSATLNRILAQSETETSWTPYGLHYTPTVSVTASRRVLPAEAGQFFVVYAAAGQTVKLHIGAALLEFGVLSTGPGNVLITRSPFQYNFGADTTSSQLLRAELSLESVIVDLGSLAPDQATSQLLLPSFELDSALADLGSLVPDQATSSLAASFDLTEVLVQLSLDADFTTSQLNPPSFALEIP